MRTHLFAFVALATTTAAAQDIPRPEHPEPMAVREHWTNLNGTWDFRFDPKDEGNAGEWFKPDTQGFDKKITVPFPWESALSGIKDTSGDSKIGWYRRTFKVPDTFPKDQQVWLRFGAIDWHADVWVNGTKVGEHDGGYTPFELNINEHVKRDADNVVVVRAFDPTDPALPVGKQVGWYTTTSGIWQTVWLEARPATRIDKWSVATTIEPPRATFKVSIAGLKKGENYQIGAKVANAEGGTFGAGHALTADGETAEVEFQISEFRDPKLWTPETPHLYDTTLEIKTLDETVIDSVKTYFGMREIKRGKLPGEDFERIFLNGKPVYLRLALDQSFNPEGIYTAPSDEFLRKDLELAKAMGLNGLRIHIKPDEPRRLYWADKLGVLIMEDMPNTWRQNEKARAAWEPTMRETIARDKNHPSIFSWVAFNETWGLGRPEDYKASKDTQDWVKGMVAEIRNLDPTRLVEDNSPCNYDHVSVTDLNSWHFYIDDYPEAKRHIEEVVAKSTPGSAFNHCPGETMNTAPLINSEYGSVSAGGGDRDISWGFRDLTTQLRKHNKIQGYVYTELTDIEWEHNGFADYDRSPKVFGYDAFVPGMTPADLQGADFIGYDAPPAVVAKVGEIVRVPVFVSHYSDRTDAPTLRWWITGVNDKGEQDKLEPKVRPVEWKAYDVVTQSKPIAFRISSPLVGALALELVDKDGKRIAANFVNIVIQPEKPAPRVERIDDHHVALRFAPDDATAATWSGGSRARDGKASGRGAGEFRYQLKLPDAVAKAGPTKFHLHCEMGPRAGRDQVDWASRVNGQDNPQTDSRLAPTSVALVVDGQRVAGIELADDTADARGVLSHLKGWDHGSHGSLVDLDVSLGVPTKSKLILGQPLELAMRVPDETRTAGGLAIFGADTGRYPFDPTLVIETENTLPADLGVDPSASIATNTIASRTRKVIETAETEAGRAARWRYTTDAPAESWTKADFDDASWTLAPGGFGTEQTPGIAVQTRWDSSDIWLRTSLDLPAAFDPADQVTLRIFHDEDAKVFVNGQPLLDLDRYVTAYRDIELSPEQKAKFQAGKNVIAVHCHQTGGGQGIDVGLRVVPAK